MDYIKDHWVEIIGATVGLLYLFYEYKADIRMWPTGIVMSSFYTVVYIQATFYAFACINIYYIIVGVYGWIQWHKPKESNENGTADRVIHTPTRFYLPILLAIAVVFIILVYVLGNYTDSSVVYADSFVTALSIVAMVMLAKKYVEQWILVIIANFASVFIFFYLTMYPTSLMYLVYAVVSVFGYFNWKKIAATKNNVSI